MINLHRLGRRGALVGVPLALMIAGAMPAAAGAGTIVVNTTADERNADGDCSLREAVQAANTNAAVDYCPDPGPAGSADVIDLAATTYALATSTGEDDNAEGDLDIEADVTAGPLTLDGEGAGQTVLNGMDMDRLLHLESGALTVEGVTVTNGTTVAGTGGGGGILAATGTELTVTGSTISSNVTDGWDGGGIGMLSGFASKSLTIVDTTISGNQALNASNGGGGIYAETQLDMSVTDSTIESNSTNGFAGGGILFGSPGFDPTLMVTDSTIASNHARTQGGGLYSSDAAEISSSVVSGNNVYTSQGADAFMGGAGLALGGIVTSTIADSQILENTSTALDAGDSNQGAGVLGTGNGTLTIARTTISDNALLGGTQSGGGVLSAFVLVVVNSTVTGNAAPATAATGGGVVTTSAGGSIYQSTISNNSAGGAGDAVLGGGGGNQTVLRGSILDGAVAADVCSGTFDSFGYNVGVGTTCALIDAGDDQPVADPGLGFFRDNGGPGIGDDGAFPLDTFSLTPASTAVGHVPSGSCLDEISGALTVDERGFPRPYPGGGACDAGAYELNEVCLGEGVTQPATAGAETIDGTSQADVINGIGGADTINGFGGIDRLCGGEGDDTLDGGASGDQLDGGPDAGDVGSFASAPQGVTATLTGALGDGSDTLAGIESLTGSPFDDQLTGDLDANVLDGAGGEDTARFPGSEPVIASLVTDAATGQGSDSIPRIESLAGSAGADQLSGDAAANTLDGVGGADVITGAGGPDLLLGGAGADSLFARDGTGDEVDCGTEADALEADRLGLDQVAGCEAVSYLPSGRCAGRAATMDGTAGADVLTGTAGVDVIAALGGNDVVRGLAGADLLCGGGGNDVLLGGAGDDRLLGAAGRDRTVGGAGRRDRCNGGAGRRDRGRGCERRRKIP